MAQFPIKNGLIQGTLAGTPTSGTLNLASLTLTLPTVPVAQGGTGAASKPCFSAYSSGATTITSGAATKILYATEDFDTTSSYDTTNSRFTAPIAGKYRINARIIVNGALGPNAELYIAKNGTKEKTIYYNITDPNTTHTIAGTVMISLAANDYVEVFAYNDSGSSRTNSALQVYTQFCGEFITS